MSINIFLTLGSLGMIVASFLPRYTEVFSSGARLVHSGLEDGIGYNSLLWGGILLLLSIFATNSTSKLKLGIEGFLSAFMVFFAIVNIIVANDIIRRAPENFWGPGIWVMVAGAVIHLVAFLFSLKFKRVVIQLES